MTSWWLIMTHLGSELWTKMRNNFSNLILAPSAHLPALNFFSEYCSKLNSTSDKAKNSFLAPLGALHNWGQRLKTFKTSVKIRNFRKISRFLFFEPRNAPVSVEKLEYSLTTENLAFLRWSPPASRWPSGLDLLPSFRTN